MNVTTRVALLGTAVICAAALILSLRAGEGEAAMSAVVTETGKITLSVDGVGTLAASGNVQVDKPAGGTVDSAYFMCASTYGAGAIADGAVSLAGTPVSWDQHVVNGSWDNHFADVTSDVSAALNAAAAGVSDVVVAESNPGAVDGCVLAVIFNDPAQTEDRTAVLMFGGQSTTGDTFTITLADPIDTSDPGLTLDMGLGISFSYQGVDGHACGGGQYSVMEVNGQALSDCAGNYDDGIDSDGALLTVGGVGDSNDNPADPDNVTEDDELYNLIPFVENGDTVIEVDSVNPSNDDNIFLAHLLTLGTARVTTEICDDEIDNDDDDLVDMDDPDCQEVPVNTPTPTPESEQGGGGGPIGGPDEGFEPTEEPASPTPVVSVAPATVVPPTPRSGAVIAAPDTGTGTGLGSDARAPWGMLAVAAVAGVLLAGAGARMRAAGRR
jgi:hypothetical protein